MFGVNDTGWVAAGMEAKAKAFVGHLRRIMEVAKESNTNLIFTRETHFSHNAMAEAWAAAMSGALEYLLRAADLLAAENNIPVIDVQGAYRDALAEAWHKDLKYEFTPDVIHPTQPGHAAMATEILRAMGVGLPLATEERGPLHLLRKAPVKLEAIDDHGFIKKDEAIALLVRCRNLSAAPVEGEVTIVAAGRKETKPASVAAYGSETLSFVIPATQLRGRWSVQPIYMFFKNEELFAANHALFYYSRVFDTSRQEYVATAEDFKCHNGPAEQPCPVSRVAVRYVAGAVNIHFQWKDDDPISAQLGFKNRFGQVIRAPLDLNNREGQPCDAVEFMFDFRPDESTGRFTSNADAKPKGVERVGAFNATQDGKTIVTTMPPPTPPEKITEHSMTFNDNGGGKYMLRYPRPAQGCGVGFSMRVTDVDQFGFGKGRVYYLTGRPKVSHEPMSYILLSAGKRGVFYRIGY